MIAAPARRRAALIAAFLLGLLGPTPARAQAPGPEEAKQRIPKLERSVYDLNDEGRYREALPVTSELLSLRQRVLGPEHPDTVVSIGYLAHAHLRMGSYHAAEPLFQRMIAVRERSPGSASEALRKSLASLAAFYKQAGDRGAVRAPLPARARPRRTRESPEGSADVCALLDNLAGLLSSSSDRAGAEPLYRRSLAMAEKVLVPEHPEVATVLFSASGIPMYRGEYARATALLERALSIFEAALGPQHRPATREPGVIPATLTRKPTIVSGVSGDTEAEPGGKPGCGRAGRAADPGPRLS